MARPRVHSLPPGVKPRLRGVLHQYAFFASLVAGAVLVLLAPETRSRLAVLAYAVALSGLLGVSALYHRVDWTPRARRWMRRLDHSMILMLIAGTYTPFALVVLKGTTARVILGVVWAAALGGVVLNVFWVHAPKWVMASIGIALGWLLAAVTPELVTEAGLLVTALMAAGGVLYTVGAVVYATGRPDPVPAVFGYHEVFHVLVIVAAAAHYAGVAVCVVPGG
jgi:hemolysin III